MKNRALSTGIILGTLFLIASLGSKIYAPEFSGFFDRGHDMQPMPIWVILLILAAVNYLYAFVAHKLHVYDEVGKESADKREQKAGGTKQD